MATIHQRVTVQPGGRVAFDCPELEAGETVEVTVSRPVSGTRRSAIDILAEAPGGRLFRTASEVDHYIRDERMSWGAARP